MKFISFFFLFLLSHLTYSQVSDDAFQQAVLSPNSGFIEIKKISNSTYIVGQRVEAEHPTDKTLLRTITLNTILQNNGNHCTMTALFPSIHAPLYDELTSDEKYMLGDILKHHFGDNIPIDIVKGEEHSPMASVRIDYKSATPSKIRATLTNCYLFGKSYIGLAAQHQKLFFSKKKQNLKEPLTSLHNSWFPYYVEDENLFDLVEEPDVEDAIGHWEYTRSKFELDFDLYNFPDRFEMYITGYVETAEVANEYIPYFEEFVATKGEYPGASKTEASLHPIDKTYVGVKITYKYDGSMTRSDFVESYNDNYSKYCNKMNKVY